MALTFNNVLAAVGRETFGFVAFFSTDRTDRAQCHQL